MHDSSDPTDQNSDACDRPRRRSGAAPRTPRVLRVLRPADPGQYQPRGRSPARGGRPQERRRRRPALTVADFEQNQLAERVNFRRIFSGPLDEVTSVQQNVERIARQVADALDDLEGVDSGRRAREPGSRTDQFPAMPTFSAGSAGELSPGVSAAAVPEHEAGDATAITCRRGATGTRCAGGNRTRSASVIRRAIPDSAERWNQSMNS